MQEELDVKDEIAVVSMTVYVKKQEKCKVSK